MPDILVSKLHIKSWLNDFYSEDNASRCKCAFTPPYKDWLVVSASNQVGCTCALIMFSVPFLISGWPMVVCGAARRYLDVLILPGLCNC